MRIHANIYKVAGAMGPTNVAHKKLCALQGQELLIVQELWFAARKKTPNIILSALNILIPRTKNFILYHYLTVKDKIYRVIRV